MNDSNHILKALYAQLKIQRNIYHEAYKSIIYDINNYTPIYKDLAKLIMEYIGLDKEYKSTADQISELKYKLFRLSLIHNNKYGSMRPDNPYL